jgi:peptidyl-prolyl cis-trans isomerase A (cyclophilin A)
MQNACNSLINSLLLRIRNFSFYNHTQMSRSYTKVCSLVLLAGITLTAQTAGPQGKGSGSPAESSSGQLPPGLYAEITTSMGRIMCHLLPSEAPRTVKNFRELATGSKTWTDPRDGKEKHSPFYDGLTFHRVIKNFMIQAGDPLGTGEGGPGFAIDDEVSPNLHFDKPGVVAMAKTSEPNSAGSQFFITTGETPWLEGKYSIFGQVIEGQDVVTKISELPTDENDKPNTAVMIQKVVIRDVAAAKN